MPLIRPHNSVPLPALFKRFALIYMPLVLALSIILLLSIRLEEHRQIERVAGRENTRVETAKALVTQDFGAVGSDLRLIASLPLFRRYLDDESPSQRDELTAILLALAKEARRYDQVRYLDASGQEVLRINYNDGKPAIVPREQLQNKSGRYYFHEALKLNQGEIYVSPLDLNIEHNQLEIPYKPVLRFGTPVFDNAGRKKGVLLFNYLGSELLQHFRKVFGGSERSGMLLNKDGYWLSSPDSADEWGFMQGKNERTFGRSFPDAWPTISSTENGMALTNKGIFAYATVYPLLDAPHLSTGTGVAGASGGQELNTHAYYWKIVSFVPSDVLSGAAFYNQASVRAWFVIVYLLFALAAWIIALITLSRKQARLELAQSKARYDELVRRIPVGVYLFRFHANGSMRFEYVSPVFCQIMGLNTDAVLQDANLAFAAAHPDDRDGLFSANQDAARSLQPFRWEGRFIVRGETRWIRIASDPTPQPDGSLWGGVVSDITERKQAQQTLMLHAELVRQMAEGMILIRSNDGTIVFANPTFERMFGYGQGELIGKPVAILVAPTDKASEAAGSEIVDTLRQTGVWSGEIENIKQDGTRFWCLANISTFEHPQYGEVWLSIHQDITERKHIEEALKQSFEEIEDLYNHAPCGYHSLDENGLFVRINHTELEWLGYSREEVVGKMHFSDLLTPTSLHTFRENFPRFKGYGYVHDLEYELKRKDGTLLPILLSATAVCDADGRFVMSRTTLFDLTVRKKLEHELEYQARIDVLTGLNNRRHFFELAEQQLARARRHNEQLSVLMLDADNFKLVNDTYGHHVGDLVLRKLSAVCGNTLREIDMSGRIGGEEFAVLLPETNAEQALEVAERLRLAISLAAVPVGPVVVNFTASIGVASLVATDTTVDDLLKRADMALYTAKNTGRNRVCSEAG